MPIPLGILAVAGAGAAALSSDYELIQTSNVGNTSTLNITGLGTYTQYKHLQIRMVARSSRSSSTTDFVRLAFNNDSTTRDHLLSGSGASVTSSTNNLAGLRVCFVPAASSTANAFAVAVIDILDFNNSNKNTTIKSFSGLSTATNSINLISGFWNNTAAITALNFEMDNGSFVSGSRFSLYGIK